MSLAHSRSNPTGTPANQDRLRKAIERNRAKQSRRSGDLRRPNTQNSGVSASRLKPKVVTLPAKRPANLETPLEREVRVASTRITTAKANEASFTRPLRKPAHRSPAPVTYASPQKRVSVTPRPRKVKAEYNRYLLYSGWAFIGVLLVRLVFSSGGVVDYYSRNSVLENKALELKLVQNENIDLGIEIKKIKKNKSYQRKLVRDNLGFIARDEYLILFPKEKLSSSR